MACDEKMALPVTLLKTPKPGVFLVSEPRGSSSLGAQNRLKMEKNLSSAILQRLCGENGGDEDDALSMAIQDVLASNYFVFKHFYKMYVYSCNSFDFFSWSL